MQALTELLRCPPTPSPALPKEQRGWQAEGGLHRDRSALGGPSTGPGMGQWGLLESQAKRCQPGPPPRPKSPHVGSLTRHQVLPGEEEPGSASLKLPPALGPHTPSGGLGTAPLLRSHPWEWWHLYRCGTRTHHTTPDPLEASQARGRTVVQTQDCREDPRAPRVVTSLRSCPCTRGRPWLRAPSSAEGLPLSADFVLCALSSQRLESGRGISKRKLPRPVNVLKAPL